MSAIRQVVDFHIIPKKIVKPLTLLGVFCFFSVAMLLCLDVRADSVPSEVYITKNKRHTQPSVLKGGDIKATVTPLSILLDPVTIVEQKAALQNSKGQPLKIGFKRSIPTLFSGNLQPLITWVPLADGTQITRFTVTSPGARALRVALAFEGLSKDVEVRFYGVTQPDQVFGPFTAEEIVEQPTFDKDTYLLNRYSGAGSAKDDEDHFHPAGTEQPFWSPVIEGETLGVEVYAPSLQAAYMLSFEVMDVSHLAYSVLSSDAKNLADIGRSGDCNIEVSCQTTTPDDLKDAVAKIIFTENGSSFLCTGSLLNDGDSDTAIPYFMTAHHCLSTQDVASTVNSFWFFERTSCNGPNPTTVTQLTGGGELLGTGAISDYTLLQLRDPLPEGVTFAAWDSEPLPQDTTVVGIHHPSGDLKKWSLGNAEGFAEFGGSLDGVGSHIQVIWSEGTTEGGSSGSGIFDAQGQFRGGLHGGAASCQAPNAPDYYGRFDITYPSVRRWLFAGETALANGVEVSGTVTQNQWQDYKIIASPAQTELTVELSNLSQDADLYVRRASLPNEDNWDCRPFLSGVDVEDCTLSNEGETVYYIGVQGYDAGTTSFTLKATLTGASPSGQTTVGLYQPDKGIFYLKDSNSGGSADVAFRFGPGGESWLPLVGDWDGDGMDTVGLYRFDRGIFYLKDSNSGGSADVAFRFGPSNSMWLPIAGDWNGS